MVCWLSTWLATFSHPLWAWRWKFCLYLLNIHKQSAQFKLNCHSLATPTYNKRNEVHKIDGFNSLLHVKKKNCYSMSKWLLEHESAAVFEKLNSRCLCPLHKSACSIQVTEMVRIRNSSCYREPGSTISWHVRHCFWQQRPILCLFKEELFLFKKLYLKTCQSAAVIGIC